MPQPAPLCRPLGHRHGQVRHELLANGRYDEARGTRESAYRGRYEVSGTPYRILGTTPASPPMATSSTRTRCITAAWYCAVDPDIGPHTAGGA